MHWVAKFFIAFFMVSGFVGGNNLFAQEKAGKIEVIADTRLQTLLDKHLEICSNRRCIQGFRIHLFSDSGPNSKTAAMECKTKFLAKYPNMEAYIIFQEPNYKVRIGNFRNRMNARGYLKTIIADYPNAYVIKDPIDFPQEY